MFSLQFLKAATRPSHTAGKPSRNRPWRRSLRHEPLEDRMLLSVGTLLQSFANPLSTNWTSFGDSVAGVAGNALIGTSRASYWNDEAAYLFDGTTGDLLHTFDGPPPSDDVNSFGSPVAAMGDDMLISSSYGVFLFDGVTRDLLQTFQDPSAAENTAFGKSIVAVGDNVLIGAYLDDTGAQDAGVAYLFNGTTGELIHTFLNPTPDYREYFGYSVAALGNNILIGAPLQDAEGYEYAGAAYLFDGFDATFGDVAGRVFADLNGDGIDNEEAALPEGFGVFLDLDLNGVRDTGEPVATTIGREGNYAFYGLTPGTYSVVLDAQSGWTPTTGPQTVTVAAGDLVENVDFGNYVPTTTTVYQYTSGEKIRDNTRLDSSFTINDSHAILDLDVQVDITHGRLSDLNQMYLFSPNGTRVDLLPWVYAAPGALQGADLQGTIFDDEADLSIQDGAAPYDGRYQPADPLNDFDPQDIQGEWNLHLRDGVRNKEAGILNSWSLIVTHAVVPPQPGPPTIDSLSDSPDPVILGNDLTLTAAGVSDPDGTVQSVAFYRDANGNGVLDVGTDPLLANDTDGTDGWSAAVPTAGLPLGTNTYFAQATDNDGLTSDPVSTTGQVVDTMGNEIYASAIDFASRLRGKGGSKHDERIVVTVRNDADPSGADPNDPLLAGVAVSVTVTGPGSFSATLSGVTNSSGVFTSTWLSNPPDGTYTATVTSISLDGFVWNTSLGTNTTTHDIPHGGASAATSVDALDQLMAGLGGTTPGGAADDDSDPLFGSLQDDVAIDLLLG